MVGSVLVAMGLAGTWFWMRIVLQVGELLRPHPSQVVRPIAPHPLAAAADVSFPSDDGLMIRGWWVLPGPQHATIILCHGHGASRTQLMPEAEFLVRYGFGVLMFDWRAHGESDGNLSTRGDRERMDLKAAVAFLARAEDAGTIGALGFSRGATVAIDVAARDKRIRAVVAEAPSPSLAEALANDLSGPALLAKWPAQWALRRAGIDVDSLHAEQSVGALSPRPLLIIHGRNDPNAPIEWATRLYAAAKEPKELWLVEGAGHGGYAQAAGARYEQTLTTFFRRALIAPDPR